MPRQFPATAGDRTDADRPRGLLGPRLHGLARRDPGTAGHPPPARRAQFPADDRDIARWSVARWDATQHRPARALRTVHQRAAHRRTHRRRTHHRPLDPHAPAQLWQVDGRADTTVGIIASVSAPFCQACDRTRLTSDGQVRSCLFSTTETDLRALLRSGATDAQLADAWRTAMWAKPRAHGLDEPWFAVPSRTMSRIGG
ncbi:hypothetical protein [Propionibacterium freudenreichii]|uniref:hypothetical protein n=1 Tax=Propionibacterium freudenreichii TaxID=1744 RepID=UPI00345D4A48